MTTGMAAQGVGPRERVPQTAQTLNVSVLANGEACTVPGVVFTAQLPAGVVCGICWGPLGRRALDGFQGGTQRQQHEVQLGGTML